MTALRPTPADRVMRAAVGVLAALPRPVLRLLAGPARTVDGQVLDPEVRIGLRVLSLSPPKPFASQPVEVSRRTMDHEAWQFGGRPLPVGGIEDHTVPADHGGIPVRLVRPPAAAGRPPLIVHFHAGGFALGSIESHMPLARFLAHHSGAAVLLVDYRLAPEHPFPAGHDDAVTAYGWALAQAERLGLSPRIAVTGDSAGGNLAVHVARTARDRGLPAPAQLVLLSPWLDLASRRRSRTLFHDGYFLTVPDLEWYVRQLLPEAGTGGVGPDDPRVSPLRDPDLRGLPPTHLAYAGFDPLRDESRDMAARLREADVRVSERCWPGLVHPFCNTLGTGGSSRRAMLEVATILRTALDAPA
ncbi:alpha/beta hydrolase [Brachybacterium sp. EF45031]|uniref:alpha/beta hydrolase n=1 Tax=Brachybacterium sillae TaxID=2810536 RepID=UPI00217CED6B|nr:alpha/beta hydrolase [Brachybacterium sillae]MCS6711422.1 alpha/beta hydrolase [Brachybacterium sillae]